MSQAKKIKWVMKTADKIESAIGKGKRIKVWTYDSIFITCTGLPYISKENFLVLERPEGTKILDMEDIMFWIYDPSDFLNSLNAKYYGKA